jgi:hypothetical protein
MDDFFHQCANMAWSTKGSKCPSLLIIHSFYRQMVLMVFKEFKPPLFYIKQLWQHEKPILSLVSFQVFHPSPYTICMLLVMGLGPTFFVFSFFRAPHCAFCIFKCRILFQLWFFFFLFFLLFFPSWVFFLYLLYMILAKSYVRKWNIIRNNKNPKNFQHLPCFTQKKKVHFGSSHLWLCVGLNIVDHN